MSTNQKLYESHLQRARGIGNVLSKYRISILELVFDLSFVVNFFFGKLLHVFSEKDEVYNYYNNKGNIFNQWFVKKGWGWTTVLILLFYAGVLVRTREKRVKVLAAATIRWAVATFWWILFTQWCFGLPLMDKVFVWTGGKCVSIAEEALSLKIATPWLSHLVLVGELYESQTISSYTCRRLKGSWEGGHDPLGHVFLLVHSSLYLFHEIQPYWPGWGNLLGSLRLVGKVRHHNFVQHAQEVARRSPHMPVVVLLGLWWFMLLVTNMYFHSLKEKLVGLVFGYAATVVVYYVPRWL